MSAKLVLVTTPIGNLGDITDRVRKCLSEQKVFYAEDTRVFKKLLTALGFQSSDYVVHSFHEHSKGKIDGIIETLEQGEDVFLVSDAGSPMISDPAYPLVKKCCEKEIPVETLPGVSSVHVALELCGLPPSPFSFWGFISREKKPKREFFQGLTSKTTHLFFESPHRIEETLDLLEKEFPHFQVSVLRELTKKFETVYRFRASEYTQMKESIVNKGEFVIAVRDDAPQEDYSVNHLELEKLAKAYLEKTSPKNLSKLLGLCLRISTKEAYELLNSNSK